VLIFGWAVVFLVDFKLGISPIGFLFNYPLLVSFSPALGGLDLILDFSSSF